MFRLKKTSLSLTLFCISFLFGIFPAASQCHLDREIVLANMTDRPLGDVLHGISKENGFYFSYNSRSFAGDSLISFNGFQGTLIEFLEKTLGPDYEFKETPGYVIIRYAPRTMEVIAETEKESHRSFTLKGCVRDSLNGKGIGQASIYDRKALVSTLSNKNGYFKLVVKRPGESIWLTVNKENYREMTMVVLLPVEVNRRARERKYGYYPDEGDSTRIERTGFGRFLIGARQRIQRINLGGFFAYSPYQVSLTPGLSTRGMFNSQVINHGSLNVIGGYTAGVDGFELAGVFNINQKNVRSLQLAGVFNLVGGNTQGVQLSGVSNTVFGDVSGIEIAGINNWTGNSEGVQLAGVFNVSKHSQGMQVAGVMNASGRSQGMQLAGVMNTAANSHGLQLAGCLNHSSEETESQISGVVNIGGKVKGVQIAGLLNVADSSNYPIGLVNIIRNGRKSIAAGTDEAGSANLAFRSGGRVLYGVTGIGYYFNDHELPYAFDGGIGVHVIDGKIFSFDMEVVNRTSTDFKKHTQPRLSLKLLPELYLDDHFSVFAGPSLSFTYPDKKSAGIGKIPGWVLYESKSNGKALHIGLSGGLKFRW